jgi:hypothetical protein
MGHRQTSSSARTPSTLTDDLLLLIYWKNDKMASRGQNGCVDGWKSSQCFAIVNARDYSTVHTYRFLAGRNHTPKTRRRVAHRTMHKVLTQQPLSLTEWAGIDA